MHTEDEARMKWCPHARAVEMDGDEPATGYPVGNRSAVGRGHPFCRCIASDCMAWRWADRKYEYVRTLNLTDDQEKMAERIKTHPSERLVWRRPEGEPLPPPGEGWVPAGDIEKARGYVDGVFDRRWKRPRPNQRGYCGLAGKP